MSLINELIQEGWLKTPRIIEAFKKIKRVDFLPDDIKELAGENTALSIGYGQTISQPLVVAFMLELLAPKEGDKILDVGSGSGWTTGLLAEIVGEKGKVVSIEIVPELAEFSKNNMAKYNFIEKGRVLAFCGDGQKGYREEAPFDKILCSASVLFKQIPQDWKEQIKVGGRIVTPMENSIWLFIKKRVFLPRILRDEEKEFEKTEYPGFVFVPLI